MKRNGLASYILIAVTAVLLGAAGSCAVQQKPPALDAVTTHGEWIYIKRGTDSIRAYVAYPERSSLSPGIIVIHEIFGLTDWEPTVADRLAKNGFIAILPDLLSSKHGITPANPDSGRKLVGQLEPERVTADLDAVYAWLNSQPSVKKDNIGTIGFCWGGGQSFRYATNNPNLKAAVVCYGPAPDAGALARINARVLGVYGENDARINTALPSVDSVMKAEKKSFQHDIYPGTGHGFLKPGRQGSDTPQVDRAWERIVAFYREMLGR
jgi:carboxymethylenebutenolidase